MGRFLHCSLDPDPQSSTSPRIPAIQREASGETLLTDEDISRGFLDFS
jgi:hypothetical protein